MKYPGFVNGSYQATAVSADVEDTINFYVERMESPGAENALVLCPTPGFLAWSATAVPQIGIRGAIFADGRLFAIFADTLYEFLQDGTWTKRGTVTQDSNPATFSYNGLAGGQLFITSGTNGYCYVLSSNTLSQVLTGEALMGAYAGGFFLAFNATNGKVRLSALNDGTSWPSTAFFQRSLFADPWQAMFVDSQNLVWLPGTDSFEVWYDAGTSAVEPFTPVTGLSGRFGIASPFGWGQAAAQILWLSRNPDGSAVVIAPQTNGGDLVSTYAVNDAIESYARTKQIGNAEGLTYQQSGHTFFCLAFPSVPQTWAFDTNQPRLITESARLTPAGNWTKRGRWVAASGSYDLWSPRVHVYAFGKHLIGDRTSGSLYEMTTAVATEIDGSGIRRLRRPPAVTQELARTPISRLELLMDVGLGAVTGQGSNPIVMMRTSLDNGRTWGNERQAGSGRLGQYRQRVYWTRLGAPAIFLPEITMSDPVPWRITDAFLNNVEQVAA